MVESRKYFSDLISIHLIEYRQGSPLMAQGHRCFLRPPEPRDIGNSPTNMGGAISSNEPKTKIVGHKPETLAFSEAERLKTWAENTRPQRNAHG